MSDSIFSREQLAGYDLDALANAIVAIIGNGAAGTNIAQSLALVGVGELRFIDPDVVERSNLPRSPLFETGRTNGKRRRYKANECALRTLAISHARNPVVRFAANRVEELGMGAFIGATVIVAAVDSLTVRARLADVARLLGIPLVELGFAGHRGHVSVWPNRSADEPCWRCHLPQVEHGGVSCTLYARRANEAGLVAATQPLAGTLGNLAAAHVLEAIHDRFPLAGKMAHLDLHTGWSRVVEVTPEPACPGAHRTLTDIKPVPVRHNGTVEHLLKAVRVFTEDPVLHLPDVYIREAPCRVCGAPVPIGLPGWAVTDAPECRTCPDVPQIGGTGVATVATIDSDNELVSRRLGQFRIGPGAIVEVTDRVTGVRHAVRIDGGLDDLYITLRREPRNARAASSKKTSGAMDAQNEENANGSEADQGHLSPPAGFQGVHRGGRLGDDGSGRA